MRRHGAAIRAGLLTAGFAALTMFSHDFLMAQDTPRLTTRTGRVTGVEGTPGSAPASRVRVIAIGSGSTGDSRDVLSALRPYATEQRRGPGTPAGAPDPAAPPLSQSGGVVFRGGRGGGATIAAQPAAAWWTNAALVARLGLSNDQKKKIEAIFEQHRQALVQNKAGLEREEAVLARMLEAEPMEPARAVTSQIERVIQARAEMERTNSGMTLEIRQNLTRAQWVQLQAETTQLTITPVSVPPGGRSGGARTGGPRAQPGTP